MTRMKVIEAALAFALLAAMSASGETTTIADLRLTNDVTVVVAAGSTQNVVRLTGGAYTITKFGGGTLNIYWTSNANAHVVVLEGVLALPRYAKPTAVFAKASFHVDASDPSTMETECVGGTNFVSRWYDADGRTCYAAKENEEARMPFVNPVETQNGLPFVDFGSLRTPYNTNDVGEALGYGASLKFGANKIAAEGITVAADTPDVVNGDWLAYAENSKMHAMSFFSSIDYLYGTGSRGIVEGAGTPKIHQSANQTSFWQGTNYLDGIRLYSSTTFSCDKRYPPGFHVFSHAPTRAWTYTHLAGARCYDDPGAVKTYVYGGQRIAEYALFPECLSQAERDELFLYLDTKWLPRKFASVEVCSGATFDASEGGVACNDFRSEGGATMLVGASTVKVNPIHPWNTVIHFDASATDTMDIVEVGGTNFVRKWTDWSGSGAYATNMNGDARMPFVNPTETLNGLPFVDFGSLRTPYNTNDVGEALGYGASLEFDTRKSAAEGITVAADTPDVVNGDWLSCHEYSKMHAMSFFSGVYETYGTGTRGFIESGGTPKIHQFDNQASFYNGINILDGVRIANLGNDVTYEKRYPAGFHVFSSEPKQVWLYTHLAGAKCFDPDGVVTYVYGGQRIAEYALYSSRLSDDERTSAYRALRWKWFAEPPMARSCAVLSVPAGASYEVMYETMSVGGTLTLGGTLKALGVSASNVVVSSSSATVAAPLTLAADAVMEFSRLPDGSFALLTAESLAQEGNVSVVIAASDWDGIGKGAYRLVRGPVSGFGKWHATCVGEGRIEARINVDAEGVTATFIKGLVVFIR